MSCRVEVHVILLTSFRSVRTLLRHSRFKQSQLIQLFKIITITLILYPNSSLSSMKHAILFLLPCFVVSTSYFLSHIGKLWTTSGNKCCHLLRNTCNALCILNLDYDVAPQLPCACFGVPLLLRCHFGLIFFLHVSRPSL